MNKGVYPSIFGKKLRAGLNKPLALLAFVLGLGFWAPVWAVDVTELVAERAAEEYGAMLPGNGVFDVRLADGNVAQAEFIAEFWMDPKTGQFVANAVTELGDTRRVWGAAILHVPVPVPVRRMLPDEIVAASDVTQVDMPWERLGAFAIADPKDLIGMQVRRMLVAGRPVPRQSIVLPTIISRGEKVKIELNQGSLQLTASGRATADAYLGQEVRVVNLSSNKIINTIARGNGVVEAVQ